MTARVTTLKGLGIAAYYLGKLGRYYSAPGEPPGQWQGRGAALSGLEGEVEQAEFENVLAGFDPAGVVVRGTRFGDTHARAFDVTFSAPKSASVLWAVGPPAVQAQVIAAHEAAVAAVVDFIDSQAVTRCTTGGVTSVVDAQGITAAVFRQHTSRAGDPQLHSHVVVSSKVQDPTGKWLALDARGLKCDQRTLSALFHASFRSEMTSRLGVRWLPPVNGISEIATVDPKVLRVFSVRTDQYEKRLQVKLDRFAETMEREPTPRERWQLEREAAKDSRPAKAKLASRPSTSTSPGANGSSTSATTPAAIPTTVAIPAADLPGWLGDLADHTIAHSLVELAPTPPPGVPRRASDGRPVSESALDRLFTTDRILDEERHIEASAYRRFAIPGGPGNVKADGLDRAQLDVARAVAGTAQLVLVVGPAGTGKTTALRPGITALQERWRNVIGLAPSATAAAVLKQETGLEYADTVDAYLLRSREYGAGRGGTTVIVDEASMLSTDKLAQLLTEVDRHGHRLVLVGDPMQLSAVGRGGMFGHLVNTHPAIELEHVHRFTNPWERQASLALRAGRPEALTAYDDHGRIHAGNGEHLEREVVERWIGLRRQGSVAVLAATNETASRLNDRIQEHRRDVRELAGTGWHHPNGQLLFVGDEVATRRNNRTLRTDRGEMIRNRARWTIEQIEADGRITISGNDGRIVLPADYAAEHLELAYAETIHAAQGRTVDHSLLLIDGPVDGAGIYVGLTRGRTSNDAYVTTDDEAPAIDILTEAINRSWADRPATEIRAELAAQEHALAASQRERGLGR